MPILWYGIKCYLCHTDISTLKQYRAMRHLTILLSTLMLTSVSFAMAQEDDMYFSPKKAKKTQAPRKVEIVYEDEDVQAYTPVTSVTSSRVAYSERDVDEYNRRGRGTQSSTDTLVVAEDADTRQSRTYELSSQNLYDLGYSEGYRQGFGDGEDIDYYYGVRLARFHGRHFFDPWYWGSISFVYDPWYWDPWRYDPWYRPYYYGGWCSVGWGIGYWGSYWHTPWHGWHTPYPHPSHWGGYYGPRYSTVRNRDYGRPRIVDRSTRMGDYRRSGTRADRVSTSGRIGNGRIDNGRLGNGRVGNGTRTERINQRSVDRYNRATERAGSRNTTRQNNNGTVNRSTRNTDRTSRSTERPTSRIGSTSTSRSNSTGGFGGGYSSGGGRSTGGSRGGGRGR